MLRNLSNRTQKRACTPSAVAETARPRACAERPSASHNPRQQPSGHAWLASQSNHQLPTQLLRPAPVLLAHGLLQAGPIAPVGAPRRARGVRVAPGARRVCSILLQLRINSPARGRPAAAGVAQQVAPCVRALRLRSRRGRCPTSVGERQVGLLPARMADAASQQVCEDPATGVPCLSTAEGIPRRAGRTSSPPAGGSPGPAAPSHPAPACHDSSAAGPSLAHAAAQSSTSLCHSVLCKRLFCGCFAQHEHSADSYLMHPQTRRKLPDGYLRGVRKQKKKKQAEIKLR